MDGRLASSRFGVDFVNRLRIWLVRLNHNHNVPNEVMNTSKMSKCNNNKDKKRIEEDKNAMRHTKPDPDSDLLLDPA